MTETPALATLATDLRRWGAGTLLPFWAETGFNRDHGSFHEQIGLDGAPVRTGFTRLRVQARQTFTFAHAHTAGVGDYALPAARAGYAFLKRCWAEEDGGFVTRMEPDGTPIDTTIDLYDQAFVLLAFAWVHKATGEAEPLAWAETLVDYLDHKMAHSAGGYVEAVNGERAGGPRRQNPHMHLFEALLALNAVTGEARWLARAEALATLLATRWIDAGGALAEYFAEDWSPWPGPEGPVREPGHQFEWVWLLDQYRKSGGSRPMAAISAGLHDFGWRHGLDRRSGQVPAVVDALDRSGRILVPTKRFWPQTEAIKAQICRLEQGEAAAGEALADLWRMLFRHYLRWDDALLRDQLSADGSRMAPTIPASSLYHLWVAQSETVRVVGDGRT